MVPYLFSASSILLIPPAPTTSRNPPNHRFLPTLSPIPPYLFPSPRLGALCSLPASLFLLSLFVFLFAFTQVMYVKSTIRVPVLIPRLPLLWSLFWWFSLSSLSSWSLSSSSFLWWLLPLLLLWFCPSDMCAIVCVRVFACKASKFLPQITQSAPPNINARNG